MPFAHQYNGAPFMAGRRKGRRPLLPYRWHGDNPVTFTSYLKHTMEHGHANDRARQFLFGLLLVSEPAVHRFPAAAAGQPIASRK